MRFWVCELSSLTFSETAFTASGLTQDEGAAGTGHHPLGMAEHGGDPVAA